MQLKAYLIENNLTAAQFAASIGLPVKSVRNWMQRVRLPRPEVMRRIEQATDGQVRPDDFIAQHGTSNMELQEARP